MTAAFVRQQGSTSVANAGNKIQVTYNTGGTAPVNGNVALMIGGGNKGSTISYTDPAGSRYVSAIAQISDGATSGSANTFAETRVLATADAGVLDQWVLTASTANLLGAILEYSGINTTTPLDVTPVTDNTDLTSLPGITTVTAGCVIVYWALLRSAVTVTAPPAGFTTRINTPTTSGTNDATLFIADMVQASNGATGTVAPTFSGTPSHLVSGLIALRPSGGAADATPTPSVVARAASVPAPTVVVPLAPAVVTGRATVPAPTVSVDSGANATFVRQQGATSITANGSNAAFDLNSGTTAPVNGHLLLMLAGNSKGSNVGWTTAAGWTNEIPALPDGATSGSCQIFGDYRIASADSGAHYAWATTGSFAAITALILEYSGVNPTTPFDVAPVTNATAATSLSGLTTVTDGTPILYVAEIGNSVTVTAPPAGFTTRINQVNNGQTFYVAEKLQNSAGDAGTVAPTLSGTPTHMVSALLALRPANSTTSATPKPATVARTGSVGAPTFRIDTTPTPSAASAVASVGAPTILSVPSQSPIAKVQGWITSTNGTASFPNTPTQGNGLLLAVNADTTITAPAGWTEAAALVNVTGLYLFTKVAGVSEPTDVTITASNAAMAVAEFEATTGVIESLTGHITRPSGNTPLDVALTGPTTNADDLTIALMGSIGATPVQWDGWTNGFLEQADTATTAANSVSLAVAVQDTTGFVQWDTAAQTFARAGGSLAACAAQGLIVAIQATAGSATVRANTVTGKRDVPAPTVVIPVDATATPDVVAGTSTVGQPVVDTPGHTVVAPQTVKAVGKVGAITGAVVDTTVTPSTVKGVGKVLPPALAGDVPLTTVQPDTVTGAATVPAPTVTVTSATNATVTPPPVDGTASVLNPTITAGQSVTVAPATVAGVGTVETPSELATDVTVQAQTVTGKATVGAASVEITVPTFRFVPPTVFDAPVVSVAPHPLNRLMKFYAPMERGQSVWVLKTGEITLQQPPFWDQVDHVYYGGHEYTVDLDEAQRLAAAGFEIGAAV